MKGQKMPRYYFRCWFTVLVFLACSVALGAQKQDDTLLPRMLPIASPITNIAHGYDETTIYLRFHEDVEASVAITSITNARNAFAILEVEGSTWDNEAAYIDSQRLDEMLHRAELEVGRHLADPRQGFYVHLPEGRSGVAAINALNNSPLVEIAMAAPLPVPPPIMPPNYQGNQGYEDDSTSGGIGAESIWANLEIYGQGVEICDVEYDFNANHCDLPYVGILGFDPVSNYGDDHGTAVLGAMVSLNDGTGTTGIAYGADAVHFAGTYNGATWDVGNAIYRAAAAMPTGSVIVIEQQMGGPNGGNYVPIEWYAPWYNAVVVAVGNGMIICEAAGNGYEDLDDAIYSQGNGGHYPFLAENDSGSIIIGAGGSYDSCSGSTWRARLSFSNYGSRVNIQGWGECVMTTGYGATWEEVDCDYTAYFNGTSSATPVVSGACMLVQSYAQTLGAGVLSPSELRTLLIDTGLPQVNPSSGNIGPFPDVVAAINTFQPYGACCISASGSCLELFQSNCVAGGGSWLGPDSTCSDGGCELEFEYPNGRPEEVYPYVITSIPVNILSGTSEPSANSGYLHLKINDSDWTETPLVIATTSDYEIVFPYFVCGDNIQWYLSFETTDGVVVTSPSTAPKSVWNISLLNTGSEPIFSDNFETDLGWLVISGAESGNWTREVPAGTGDFCEPATDVDGSGICFVTGNNYHEDVDNGLTYLYSPTVQIDMAETPQLSYYRWYSNGSNCGGANTYEDMMTVQATTDGGSTFTTLEIVGPTGDGVEGGWIFAELELADLMKETGLNDVRFLFIVSDEGGASIVEAAIDNVTITQAACGNPPACYVADIDKDGFSGVNDLLLVIDQWGTDGSADVNADGIVDVGDLLAIVDVWGECSE